MNPRDYQTAGMNDIRAAFSSGHKRVVFVCPTGSGKGWMIGAIAHGIWTKGKRAIIVAHRSEIVRQLGEHLDAFRVQHGMVVGGQRGLTRLPIIVGSVIAVSKRAKHIQPPDLIFIDECHHAVSGSAYAALTEAFPNARLVGFTATPTRLDGRGLGESFDHMVLGPTVAELMAQGYLTSADIYSTPVTIDRSQIPKRGGDFAAAAASEAMDKRHITGDAIAHYRALADGKAAVVFCCSVAHAQHVADEFCRAGYKFVAVDGKMDPFARRQAIVDLASGAIHGITSCDVISEGVDVPRIECVIDLQPTESKSRFLQKLGRGLRIYPGKECLIVLDHAGNVAVHGFPDDEREWSLAGRAKSDRAADRVTAVRQCPICYKMHRPSPVCPKCGHVYIVKGREVEQVDGELVRVVGGEAVSSEEAATKERARQFGILRNIAKKRNYENPSLWAFHVIAGKEATRLAKLRGGVTGTVNGLTEDELTRLWHELQPPKEEMING